MRVLYNWKSAVVHLFVIVRARACEKSPAESYGSLPREALGSGLEVPWSMEGLLMVSWVLGVAVGDITRACAFERLRM